MSKRRKIYWQEAGVTKEVNQFSVGINRTVPGECALFLVCALFFFLSACSMIESVFAWKVFTIGAGVRILFSALLVCVLMEGSAVLPPKTRKWIRYGMAPGGCILLLLYLLVTGRMATVSEGFSNMLTAYGNYWNEYKGMTYTTEYGLNPVTEEAVLFGITLLCFLFTWLARLLGKTWILLLVPAGVFTAALLVGMSPSGAGLWLFAIGVLLSGAGVYKKAQFCSGESGRRGLLKLVPWLPSAVVILLLCIAVSVFGTGKAVDTVTDGRKKLNAAIEDVANWSGWDKFRAGQKVEELIRKLLDALDIEPKQREARSERAELDNTTPQFIGRGIVNVSFDEKPKGAVYLQEYYLDSYKDGEWYTDVSAFEKACSKAGFPSAYVSERLSLLARTTMEAVARTEPDPANSRFKWEPIGWIQYTSAVTDRAFLPYFSTVTTDGGRLHASELSEIYIDGHVRYQKNRNLQSLPIDIWNYDRTDLMDLIHATDCRVKVQEEPWESWYESYLLSNFLKVPSGMEQVKKAAAEADRQNLTFLSIEGVDSVNADRLNTAYKVAQWLSKNARYTMEPPELPAGTDPVEFFLGTSRQGYCMHFSSAATLMLRTLGVPARYGAGYMKQGVKGIPYAGGSEEIASYSADFVDSDAHAWVEIYLNGIGWIPIEVTSGNVASMDQCTVYKKDVDGAWTMEYVPADSLGTGQNASVNPGGQTITPAPDDHEHQQEEVVPPEDTGREKEQENAPEKESEEKEKEKKFSFGTVAAYTGVTVGAVALGVAVILWLRKKELSGEAGEERRYRKKTRRFGNRRRIKYLNQRLYRKLRRRRVLKRKPVWDGEYGAVLKEYCTGLSAAEVDRFMYLVKAAMFSYEEFSDEEVAFCKAFYHKVLYEKV